MFKKHRATPSQAPRWRFPEYRNRIAIIILLAVFVILIFRYKQLHRGIVSEVFDFQEISFRRDYERMERDLKVYIYRDRDPGMYFQSPRKLTGMYGSEAYFFKNIKESRFRTTDPLQAHLFFIPISWNKMRSQGTPYENMTIIVENYVQSLISKYPYWNQTQGADHFFVVCHEIGVEVIEGVPLLKKNSIRLVCPASYDTHYVAYKDIALPQVNRSFSHPAGKNAMLNRTKSDLWAGIPISKIRASLEHLWKDDTELDSERLWNETAEGHLLFHDKIYRRKFCICPHGFPANSAIIADSIRYGCVPVIFTNYTDFPLNGILHWNKFSMILDEDGAHWVKDIFKGIKDADFTRLQDNLLKVKKHFEWNSPPVRFDAFHMVMLELWRRTFEF